MAKLLKIQKALWSALLALGPWGIFLAGAVDGAGIPLPGAVDALMLAYVVKAPGHAWLFVLLAISGSLLGSLVLYLIGYLGGEVVLERRISPEKFHKISEDFDRNAFLTIAVPAVLPPPFPFKIFVLAAGAFEIHWTHFLLAVLAGRVVRYTALAVLAVTVGPGVLTLFGEIFHRHPLPAVAVLAALVAAVWLLHRWRQNAAPAPRPTPLQIEGPEPGSAD